MAILTVIEGALKGASFDITAPVVRIGRREEGNDWTLADPSVSGSHCEIENKNGEYVLRDLGSTNGTKVNNEPVKEKTLRRNDVIKFGDIPVLIEGDDVPEDEPAGEPTSITRTTISISQNKKAAPPKEFAQKKSSNALWIVLIIALIGLVGYFLFQFLAKV